MGRSANISGLKLIHEQNKPILMHGLGGRLLGSLILKNETETKLTLKSMPIQVPRLRGEGGEPLTEVRLFGRLYPTQQGRVDFELPIDPSTPSGTYEATVQIGEQTYPVQIRVGENVELDVQPDSLILDIKDQRSFERELAFTNIGNVAIPLGEKWIAALQTQQGIETQMVESLKELCEHKKEGEDDPSKSEGSLMKMLCALSKRQPGPVILFLEDVTLEPGETRLIKATLRLPDDMQPHRHYFAEIDLFSASILLDVYTRS
jgi:hypothetical protein